jgi:hypothetical protein
LAYFVDHFLVSLGHVWTWFGQHFGASFLSFLPPARRVLSRKQSAVAVGLFLSILGTRIIRLQDFCTRLVGAILNPNR